MYETYPGDQRNYLLVATNLAYVRHFARQDSAQSATFQSINSRGFTLSYTLSDGTEGEAFIEFATPLRRKEEIRPVLEEMAKEAESALGLVCGDIYFDSYGETQPECVTSRAPLQGRHR